MPPNFSFNDATRIIDNVIAEKFRKLTGSGAGTDYQWGTIAALPSAYMASVYLDPSTLEPSYGFRIENGLKPNVLDPVRVAIDKRRGNKWIEAVLNPPEGGFIDVRNRTLLNAFPSGGIIMWHGTIASIPSGWALCDGTNGTPDLRDRMIVGEGTTPGGTGGTISPTAALTGHTNHTFTQPSGHSNHTFTQPSGHSNHTDHTTHGVHSTHATHSAHSGHVHGFGGPPVGWTTMALTSGSNAGVISSFSQALTTEGGGTGAGGDHSGHDAHSAHSAHETHGAHSAHTGGSVDGHSAHTGGSVDAHSAHAIYKYYKLAFIMKV